MANQESGSPSVPGPSNPTMIGLTTDQFIAIMDRLSPRSIEKSSLLKCPAEFRGFKSTTSVESFLSAISAFKEIKKLDDDDVLKGLFMVLKDDAADWWEGIKHTVHSFEEFKQHLRDMYAPRKMAYEIYQDIVENKQDDKTRTDVFIQTKRMLLSQLPSPGHSESQEIDLVYGQLRFEIRERMSRDSITTFDQLLERAREIERNLGEKAIYKKEYKQNVQHKQHNITQNTRVKLRCNFCRAPGHTIDVCRKRLKSEQSTQKIDVKENDNMKPKFSCYGCGEPGIVRSRCPKCNIQKVKLEEISFCAIGTKTDKRLRPTVPISIGNIHTNAYVDTCAKSSVASYQLYTLLQNEGYVFKKEKMYITFADGIAKMQTVLTVTVPISVYGRIIPTSFIVLPHAKENKTLLGVGFIQDSMMVINLPQLTCRFLDDPATAYDLKQEDISETILEQAISDVDLPELLSPIASSPKKVFTSNPTETSLKRPYGPSINLGMVISPKVSTLSERVLRHPRIADEAPFSSSVQSTSTLRPVSSEMLTRCATSLPLDVRTPPHKRSS